jgi:hypothetical protein
MELHGHIQLEADIRKQLLGMSASTIDRALAPARAERSKLGRRKRNSSASVKAKVPVRTFADWDDPAPGFFEIDFVVHGGGSSAGRFIHSLSLTDIASGWTEAVPLLARNQDLVVEALEQVRAHLPMPMLGIDTDNDSAFINDSVIQYCARTGLEFTRGRPRKKNDQAWIEQKNGAVIRHLVGYERFEGIAHAKVLARLYAAARLYVNIFQPSFKLKSKERIGSKIKKTYYPPATPAQRLRAHPQIGAEVTARLEQLVTDLDPVRLLKIIRDAQSQLAGEFVAQEGSHDEELEAFLGSLSQLWKLGEVRPTHKKKPRPPRKWRTRKDSFEHVWSEVEAWLELEPDLTAKLAFARLQKLHPNEFKSGQLRTLQRRFQAWRLQAARELVFIPAEQLPDQRVDLAG